MKETRRYFSRQMNESVNRSYKTARAYRPIYEAVKMDEFVTEDNMESAARKIKKLTGCKVIFDNGNLLCGETNKVIVRNALNGKRTVEYLADAVNRFIENLEAKKNDIKESVAERFAAYRHLYEQENEDDPLELDKDDLLSEDDDEDPFNLDDDSESKKEETEGKEGKKSEEDEDKEKEESDDKSDEENEDVPLTAVVLRVKKDDGKKLNDELIEAGIPEDDIDVIEGEEDEDDKVKVDANSIHELKDFLNDMKGIDLEEKLGGEIIDDEEGEEDKEGEKEDDEKSKEGEDDLDFGSDDDLDALFGADDDSADSDKK